VEKPMSEYNFELCPSCGTLQQQQAWATVYGCSHCDRESGRMQEWHSLKLIDFLKKLGVESKHLQIKIFI
jgi:hypothetical protein